MNKQELYQYYYDAFNVKSNRVKKHSREAWNEKAGKWKVELSGESSTMSQVTRQRVANSVEILKRHGLLGPDRTLIDIGCGPGRFVAGFAPYVARAEGTDISDEMLDAGRTYCREKKADNTAFYRLDFKELDLDEMGWRRAYDICFSFMSPAVSKYDTLHKMMDMSRGWCSSSLALSYQSRLDQEILQVLKPKEAALRKEEEWFYNMFNLLWLEGYRPITDYYTVQAQEDIAPDEELIRHRIRRQIKDENYSDQDINRVMDHLQKKSEKGLFREETKNLYGSILWRVEK